jgi:hypothetical protein
MKFRYHLPLTTRIEEAEHAHLPRCQEPTGVIERACLGFAEFTLAWTVNESGLPGLGEDRIAYVCGPHVLKRIDKIPFEYAGSVTVTPLKEIHEQ